MGTFKKKISFLVIGGFLFGTSALVFQNCSRTTFSQIPGAALNNVNGVTQENSCSMRSANADVIEVRPIGQCACPSGVKSSMDGSTLVCGDELICKNDEQKINGVCTPFQCKSYQELAVAPDGKLTVPARDISSGICYYTKLLNGNFVNGVIVPTQERVAENIISRDHDDWEGNIKPKNLGYKGLSILLNGKRALKLVGPEKTETSKLDIDNYFLIRMNSDSYTHAYGTRDASFIDPLVNVPFSDYIMYNDKKVNLTSYIDGGTAYVDPIDITSQIRLGVTTDLHIHALDCGAGQQLHEVYLLMQ